MRLENTLRVVVVLLVVVFIVALRRIIARAHFFFLACEAERALFFYPFFFFIFIHIHILTTTMMTMMTTTTTTTRGISSSSTFSSSRGGGGGLFYIIDDKNSGGSGVHGKHHFCKQQRQRLSCSSSSSSSLSSSLKGRRIRRRKRERMSGESGERGGAERMTTMVLVKASSSSSEHNEETNNKLKRDEASMGCSSCYFPREKDRAREIARASLDALNRSKPFGTALVVGAETGELVESLLSTAEAKFVTACDASQKQLDRAMERVPDVGVSGNEKGAKYFQLSSEMSLEDVKPYFGPFDVIIFNDAFEDVPEEKRRETLARAANLLKQTTTNNADEATSRIIISSRETKEGDESYRRMTREELNALVKGFPLAWTAEEAKRGKPLDLSDGGSKNSSGSDRSSGSAENDDDDLDATRVLYLTQNYKLEKPLLMRAKVVRGFGRGSAEMGLPTANLDPAEVSLNWQKEMNDDTIDVENIPLGVYFGYCHLEGDDDSDKKIAVLNVGRRPSFVDKKDYENEVTVEVHCVEKNEDGLAFENGKKQFYGETMSVECLGFVRPEMKFNGLDELITRIKTDVGLSKNSLTKMTGV